VRRLCALVDELFGALAAFDPALLPRDDCVAVAALLARAANACEAGSARAAARAVECGWRGDEQDASPFEWLARVAGRSTGAAQAALRTVAADECAATLGALSTGDVSLAQAAEIVWAPEHESELLELARTSGLRAVKERARKRRCEAVSPEELYTRQHAAREFRHWKDEIGMIRFRGALAPDVGIPFVNRLDREIDRCRRAARREKRDESRAALAADAFVALTDASRAGRTSKCADVVLVCDLNAYRRGHTHDGEACRVVGGGPIPVAVARELEADAFLKAVLHDGVNVHTVAHFGRHRPAHLETALMLGAPPEFEGVTCDELGCDRRYGLEWDHVDPVANGGRTEFRNLKARCKPHHLDKTERDRRAGLLGSRARAP
jgi:hypothetical protein